MDDNVFMNKDAVMLFELAKEFNNIKPWQWLGDTDVFGIKFHDMEDIIFCSVLGCGEQVYGMAIYTGLEGIDSYFKLLDGRYDLKEEVIHIQNAITINFDDRKDITNEDYSLIKMSGINFRGKKQWPIFRRYEPGYVPWNLSDEELFLMTRVLEVAKHSVLYYKENPNKAALMEEGKCCVWDIKKDSSYEERIIEYNKLEEESRLTIKIPITYNELDMKRLSKRCNHTKDTWEIDSFFHVNPVDDEDIPFFPAILLIVDKNDELIIGNHVTHPYYIAEEFQQYILEYITKKCVIPHKVILSNPHLFVYLEGLLDGLGVQVELTRGLELIPMIKKDFFTQW